MITRRGKLVGFFVPVDDPASLPWGLRCELLLALTERLRGKAIARFEEFRQILYGKLQSLHVDLQIAPDGLQIINLRRAVFHVRTREVHPEHHGECAER